MSTFVPPEEEVQSVRVRLANRVFPTAGKASKVPLQAIYQLQADPDPRDPQRVLAESVWQRLPWVKSQAEVDRTVLVQRYVASLETLARFRDEADGLVRAACRASIEFRQGAGRTHDKSRREALDRKLQSMIRAALRPWTTPANVLDAQLVSQDVETVRQRLEYALRESVADFARQFFELLAHLVDRKLAGLVEWLPNNCCRYHFFKKVVIQEYEGSSRNVREELGETEVRDATTGRRIVGRRITEDIHRGRHIHRHARHEHHVMNAFRTSLGNSRVVVPPQVERMLKAIPQWLYEQAEMIDGDIFRERIIEQDYHQEAWQEVRVKDEPIYGCEPGVIVGSYVLTGWGPREVAAEQARRAAAAKKDQYARDTKSAKWRSPVMQIAAAIMLFLALVLWMRYFQGGSLLFAGLATLTGMAALYQAMLDRGVLKGAAAQDAPLRTGVFACAALVPQMLVAVWYGAGLLGWMLTLLLAAGVVACGYRLYRLSENRTFFRPTPVQGERQ